MIRLSLQVKLVVGLLIIAAVPVAVSAFLIDRISNVAQSFASRETEKLRPPLERAEAAYRELVETKKELYQQIVRRLAENDEVLSLKSVASEAGLKTLHIDDGTGRAEIPVTGFAEVAEGRTMIVRYAIPDGNAQLVAGFVVPEGLSREYEELGRALTISSHTATMRRSLPSSYRIVFLLVVGGFAVLLTVVGWYLGRRVTRRIDELVLATRAVAEGDLSARAPEHGSDELTDVSRAFNLMVADLAAERSKRLYLQRIGTWQDVARKLAHEIKNPLTPIQLAIQQVQSSYREDNESYKRLLADCEEIVSEEISNLKRLVDAFSALGRLPRVEAKSLDFAIVVDDLNKDPVFLDSLKVDPPDEAISVRADRLLLRRVLANLVANGMEAGPDAKGEVRVQWRVVSGSKAMITVDDEGEGVPDDKREAIFEPYVTTKETGTGLGLAISKKICIEHGGDLVLADEASPQGGARFVVTIPLATES